MRLDEELWTEPSHPAVAVVPPVDFQKSNLDNIAMISDKITCQVIYK